MNILNILEEKFRSKININQLNRWFQVIYFLVFLFIILYQYHREKSIKAGNDKIKKNPYKKFVEEEVYVLEKIFEKVFKFFKILN